MKLLCTMLTVALSFGFLPNAIAQLQVDKQVQMIGSSNTDKQITGVGDPTAGDHAVNAGNVQSGALIYAGSAGSGGNYTVTLTPTPGAYTAGMIVNLVANHSNTGAATLNVNSLGDISIKKGVTNDLDAGDIASGQAVSLMFDGTNFQLLSGVSSSAKAPCYTCDGW
jgi:hypothetical protein